MPSRVPQGQHRGWIIAIGGAENKENDRRILERFVGASGGAAADIVVIPTASRMHETGPRYERLFADLGAARVTVNEDIKTVHENESIYIPIGAVHRLENPGKILLELIEVQTGSYLGEDDIVRYEDTYGRA